MLCCYLVVHSCPRLFVTPQTVTCQAPLEWVAISLGRLEKYFRKMKVLFRPESYRQIEGGTEVLMGKGFLIFRGLGPCQ